MKKQEQNGMLDLAVVSASLMHFFSVAIAEHEDRLRR